MNREYKLMKTNYLITCSHADYKNMGRKVNVDIFVDKNDAIKKILDIHKEFCHPHNDQYSYSDKFINFKRMNKFMNDKIHEIDPDYALDCGLYVNDTYERLLCSECEKEEAMLLEKCICRYYINIKTKIYKREMCDDCLKYCDCDKCNVELWKLIKCTLEAKAGTCENDRFRDDFEELVVYIGINVLDGEREISTSWNP